MEPEIKAGENIIVKECKKYDVGDIITYITEEGEIITHRIVSIDDYESYHTKGDANNVEDPIPVAKSQIYGKVIYHFNSILLSPIFSYAKYVNSNSTSVNFKIAKPIFVVEGDKEIVIEGYERSSDYNFIVKNYNESDTSDVAFNYKIEIVSDENVEYKLFCENILIDTNNIFTLPRSDERIEHTYLLKLEVPEDYKGTVKINVYAYQKEATKS